MTLVAHKLCYGSRQNARTWGNQFRARFLEAGLISYKDVGGDMELLSKETLDRCAESFVGRPVIIKHKKVRPETMEGVAVGYISRVWFEPMDGWYWCEGVITNDEAKALIANGWSVSCGYNVRGTDECGGVYHCIPYRREVTSFEGEHLAIVERPRYEGATIRLNSKPKTNMTNLFKLFSPKKATVAPAATAAPATEPKTEERTNAAPASTEQPTLDAATMIEVADGKAVSLGDLIARYNEKPAETTEVAADTTVEVAEGKQVPLSDLVNRYNETEAKRENETKTAAATQPFKVLATAKSAPVQVIERHNSAGSLADGLARGKARYGVIKPINN